VKPSGRRTCNRATSSRTAVHVTSAECRVASRSRPLVDKRQYCTITLTSVPPRPSQSHFAVVYVRPDPIRRPYCCCAVCFLLLPVPACSLQPLVIQRCASVEKVYATRLTSLSAAGSSPCCLTTQHLPVCDLPWQRYCPPCECGLRVRQTR
jgi:hypothetical protein